MHRLLKRQIDRYLTNAESVPPEFVAAIDAAYASADADRLQIERTLELMSQELTERNQALRNELAERQHAEAKLEHLLALLGTILEATADGILGLDKDGVIVRFNQRFEKMWNIPDEILAFWSHAQIVEHVVSQLDATSNFLPMLDYLCRHPEAKQHELLSCTDGRVIELYSLSQPQGTEAVGRVLSFRDVTERKRADEALEREKEQQRALIKKLEEAHNQLLQAEKMASIGQLAAGVAHEINNPIGFINSNCGALRDYVAGMLELIAAYEADEALLDDAARQRVGAVKQRIDLNYLRDDVLTLLHESMDGIKRVRQIVQDLKDFSHIDEGTWQCADLHHGLDSTLNIVNNEVKYVADVVKEYGVLPEVECLPLQLNQVFLNLLVNAAQAMHSQRGTITIRTGVEDAAHVFVEISDNGTGIAPENLKRIFDPFFTTKPVGTGTGLGLSVSYGIIIKHGGSFDVRSELGQGATFRIVVPISRRAS